MEVAVRAGISKECFMVEAVQIFGISKMTLKRQLTNWISSKNVSKYKYAPNLGVKYEFTEEANLLEYMITLNHMHYREK